MDRKNVSSEITQLSHHRLFYIFINELDKIDNSWLRENLDLNHRFRSANVNSVLV